MPFKVRGGASLLRATNDSIVYAADYGFGTGATAAANKTALVAAMTAASLLTQSVIVKVGHGSFSVDGGITQPANVILEGFTAESTRLNHSSNDAFLTCLAVGTSLQRGWRYLRITGNSGASAKGIVYGNATNVPVLHEVTVTGYSGGTGVEVRNSDAAVGWTEESSIFNLVIAGCGVGLDFVKDAAGFGGSFSSTRIKHALIRCTASGQIGVRFGAGTHLYSSDWNLKIMLQANNVTAIDVAAGVFLQSNHYNILVEYEGSRTGLVMLNQGSGSIISGTGAIYPYGPGPTPAWTILGQYDVYGPPGGVQNRTGVGGSLATNEWSSAHQRFVDNLTSNLTVTLPTINLYPNKRMRFERAGYGNATLTVGSPAVFVFPANTTGWVEIVYDARNSVWVIADHQFRLYDPVRARRKVAVALSETISRDSSASSNLNLTSGTLHLSEIQLLAGMTVTNIKFFSGGQGIVTATNWWFSLHDSARAFLRSTANQLTAAWGANVGMPLALSSPYVVPTDGTYYVGIMVAATTPPTLAGLFSTTAVAGNEAPAQSINSTSGMTTPPADGTAAAFTSAGQIRPYAYVS